MNKTSKIIIGILIVVCGFLIVFSKIQASEAEKQTQASVQLAAEGEKLRVDAERFTARANRLATDAIAAQTKAEQAYAELQECKGSK